MNKKVATEIVKAGFRTLAKTYHPDTGGTHEAMLVLKDTYEGLIKAVENGNFGPTTGGTSTGRTSGRGQREGFSQERKHWSDDFREKAQGQDAGGKYTGPVLEKYKAGYFLIRDVHCVGATPKAIQVMFPGNPVPAWVPRSQIYVQDTDIVKEGDRGKLIITDWIAAQKGWRLK
jgi:hypothetical protein